MIFQWVFALSLFDLFLIFVSLTLWFLFMVSCPWFCGMVFHPLFACSCHLILPLYQVLFSFGMSFQPHWNSISLTTMSSCLLMGIFGVCPFFTCICRFCIHCVFQWLDFHGFTQFYMSTKQHIIVMDMHLHPNNFTKSNVLIIHLHCHG